MNIIKLRCGVEMPQMGYTVELFILKGKNVVGLIPAYCQRQPRKKVLAYASGRADFLLM